jgi:DNA-binding MarR family transcriptional regulator
VADRQTARKPRGAARSAPQKTVKTDKADRAGKAPKRLKSSQDGQSLTGIPGYLVHDQGEDFDRLVHERVRLGVLSALAVNKSLSFADLKQLLKATDGNLSVHARKLEEAGYIACTKTFAKRLPRTEYQLSAKGRKALARYLDHMEALIHATRGE